MATTMAARPLRLQDMLKTAMAESSRRVSVGLEAERQLGTPVEEEKTASVPAGVVNSEYALKLASAIEFIAADFDKQAEGVGTGPNHLEVTESNRTETFPAHQGEGHHTVPMHTGLQAASQSGGAKTQVPNDADRAPGGPGHQTTAMSGGQGKTASELRTAFNKEGMLDVGVAAALGAHKAYKAKGSPGEGALRGGGGWLLGGIPGAVLGGLAGHVLGGGSPAGAQVGMMAGNIAGGIAGYKHLTSKYDKGAHHKKKHSSGLAMAARELQSKLAADALNPARISAGSAVPPDTSASGEAGGAPVAGMPQGPRGLVHSNESAMNYKRNQAYGGRKSELSQYFSEPALTQSTDKTLAAAFDHTSEAGTKFASASGGSTKVAAARAILSKLAEETEASVKDKGEKSEKENGSGASH